MDTNKKKFLPYGILKVGWRYRSGGGVELKKNRREGAWAFDDIFSANK